MNAAILILAATVFYKNGIFEVAEIKDAHALLQPLLGTSLAPVLFALALIAAGQSSTLTGTLAGQIVMEGYLNLRIQPWVRRLLTRLVAILPAFITIYLFGENSTGELLVLSQVVLSLQLGFAIIPLIHFVSDQKLMKGFHIKWPLAVLSWLITLTVVGLNAKLVWDEIGNWLQSSENPVYIWIFVVPVAIGAALLTLFIILWPLLKNSFRSNNENMVPHITSAEIGKLAIPEAYNHIAVSVDFSVSDKKYCFRFTDWRKGGFIYAHSHSRNSGCDHLRKGDQRPGNLQRYEIPGRLPGGTRTQRLPGCGATRIWCPQKSHSEDH